MEKVPCQITDECFFALQIGRVVQDVEEELASHFDLEVVLVNDGSPADNSAEVCEDIARSNSKVRFVNLSRNFGEHNAVMAGLNYCTGDAAVIMDDDSQNPASEVIKLVDKLNEGHDVVYSYYSKKEHSLVRNLGSKFNNLVASVLIHKPMGLAALISGAHDMVAGRLTYLVGDPSGQ